MDLVIEHARCAGDRFAQQIFAHDHDGQAGRSNVLLRAGVDHAVFRHVDRFRQNIGGHIRHQRHIAGLGHPMELHAADGFVRRVVHIGRVSIERPFILGWRIGKTLVFGRGRDIHAAILLRFLDGLFRPFAGIHIVRAFFATQQIHRHHGELTRCAAL